MVIGLAALGGAALSPLQGLGFGFGYGYGVRLGYHSFKPSKSEKVTGMRLSPEPFTAGAGMGLASAEENTGKSLADLPVKGFTDQPTQIKDPTTNLPQNTPLTHQQKLQKHGMIESNDGSRIIKKSLIKTHEQYVAFKKHNIVPNSNWY